MSAQTTPTYPPLPMAQLVGTHNVVWIILDSLRLDVAEHAHLSGQTPTLSALFPLGWEHRHAPGTFTLPSHIAMFAGFLPTPAADPNAPVMVSGRTPGREAVTPSTFVFDEASFPEALRGRGYRTVCIGGVGFFSSRNAISSQLPALFAESYYRPGFGPGRVDAVKLQVKKAQQILTETSGLSFVFLNIAATHQPTRAFVDGAKADSVETQAAALHRADSHLAPLLQQIGSRGSNRPTILIVCSDHGDAFGEDGFWGHRLSHRTVLDVPYAHRILGSCDE
jgi:Sulfatase